MSTHSTAESLKKNRRWILQMNRIRVSESTILNASGLDLDWIRIHVIEVDWEGTPVWTRLSVNSSLWAGIGLVSLERLAAWTLGSHFCTKFRVRQPGVDVETVTPMPGQALSESSLNTASVNGRTFCLNMVWARIIAHWPTVPHSLFRL